MSCRMVGDSPDVRHLSLHQRRLYRLVQKHAQIGLCLAYLYRTLALRHAQGKQEREKMRAEKVD